MAGKRKLEHFEEMKTFPNVFEPNLEEVFRAEYKQKGNWNSFFEKDQPLVLELGCGKGEYTLGLAKLFPDKNFIGIDIKGARMWRGAKTSLEEGIKNVAFLRTRIEFIESCFAANEVDEIWITFPDPQPKDRQEKKRLTNKLFIDRYQKFLKKDGIIHLKTDSLFFFDYTLDEIKTQKYRLIESTHDLYADSFQMKDPLDQKILNIKTHYERIFTEKGHNINYLQFQL